MHLQCLTLRHLISSKVKVILEFENNFDGNSFSKKSVKH